MQAVWWRMGCIISSFYIKPQLSISNLYNHLRCIISSFYIKPQPFFNFHTGSGRCIISSFYIKPQLTNQGGIESGKLYYIFILHQTTTVAHILCNVLSCIISSFYIKPQPRTGALLPHGSCIISSFYIKPQHIPLTLLIFSRLKTILGDMKLFDEAYLIQSY